MSGTHLSLSGDLTPMEEQLVQTVLAGRRVDLKGETIRASMLRTLVTEVRSDWALPPIGLLLDNAVIQLLSTSKAVPSQRRSYFSAANSGR